MNWDRTEEAILLEKGYEVMRQMKAVEGFALTEDTYTARIPGKDLKHWHDVMEKIMFRLRGALE